MAEPIPAASREVGADLEVVRDAPVEVHRQDFSRDQVELIKRTICAGATDDELALFIKVAERTGLDPFARQIHAVKRWDSEKGNVMSIQVGIDGFRLIAERTRRYAGRLGPYWCGEDGEWLMDNQGRPRPWLAETHPSAAMVGVRHASYSEPLWAVATWRSYVQTKKGGAVTHMWATKGDLMLAKCAEALALRGAFPAELSGLYTDDEMGQSTNATPDAPPAEPTPAKAEGWADAAAEAAAHKAVADAIRTLYEDIPADHPVRAEIKAYRAEHGWPMSADNLKALMVTVAKATNPSEPQEAPETPKPAKSRAKAPTPAPEAPSAPTAAPEDQMPWDGMPDPEPSPAVFVCPWCENPVLPTTPSVVTGGAGGKSVEKWHKDCFAEKEAEVAGEDDPGRPFTE